MRKNKPFFTTDTPICLVIFLLICWIVFSDTVSPEFGAWFFAAAIDDCQQAQRAVENVVGSLGISRCPA